MNMNKTIMYVGLIIVIISGVFLAGCNKQEPIKIGFIGPLSGDAALYGMNPQKGVMLAIDELNAQGGINGKELVLVSEDSVCSAPKGVSAAKKLIEVNNVNYIIGGMCSSVTLAIAPIAEQNKVVVVSPVSTNYQVSEAGEHIFRTVPSDALQGKKGAELAFEKGFRKAAILYIGDNDYGLGLKQVFEQRFTELGGEVVIAESHLSTDSDFRTQLTKINLENPDVLYVPTQTQEAGLIVKQAKELGLEAQIMGTETMQDEQFVEVAGSSAEGVMFTSFAEYQGPSADRFLAGYKEKYDEEKKGIYSDYAYDALYAIANAIKECGSEDTECVKNRLYETELVGATGTVSFDGNGDVKGKDFAVFKVSNGEFVKE